MNKLRLLLFESCDRNCEGCCNKDWDLKELPIVKKYNGYNEVLLTGGEPMLYPVVVADVISDIRKQNSKAKIYMYTAKCDDYIQLLCLLNLLDGVTITLHEQGEVLVFCNFLLSIPSWVRSKKSIRLNIFKGVELPKNLYFGDLKIKDNIEWIENCPLPKDEVFMRLL